MAELSGPDYPDEVWADCVPDGLLRDLDDEEFLLLHRHWMWGNRQRTLFYERLGESEKLDAMDLASPPMSFMLLWYSLLWAVIEAFDDRGLQLAGPFAADIEKVRDLLRRCRNAVLHVPKAGEYFDERIVALMSEPGVVDPIIRINRGFGRLFMEEIARRREAPEEHSPGQPDEG